MRVFITGATGYPEMTNALVQAVESGPPGSARHLDVPAIRAARIDGLDPPLPSRALDRRP